MKIKMYFCSMKKHVMVKKTKSLFFATIFLLSTSLTAEAQMLIQQNGHVYVGQAPRPDDDLDNVLTMSLQGNFTAYNAGGQAWLRRHGTPASQRVICTRPSKNLIRPTGPE